MGSPASQHIAESGLSVRCVVRLLCALRCPASLHIASSLKCSSCNVQYAGMRLLSMACPTYLCIMLSGFSAHCVVAKMLLVQCAACRYASQGVPRVMCSQAGARLLSMVCPTCRHFALSGFSAHCVVAETLLVQCAVCRYASQDAPRTICSQVSARLLSMVRPTCWHLRCPASLHPAIIHLQLIGISGLSAHCTRSVIATTQCAERPSTLMLYTHRPSTLMQYAYRPSAMMQYDASKYASGRSPASPYSDSDCSTDRHRAESPASTWRRTDSPY